MRKFAFILLTSLLFCACQKDDVDASGSTSSSEYITIHTEYPLEDTDATVTQLIDTLTDLYGDEYYDAFSHIKVTGRIRSNDFAALKYFEGVDLSDVSIDGTIATSNTTNEYTTTAPTSVTTGGAILKSNWSVTNTGTPVLKEIILPDNLRAIGFSAFCNNTLLEKVIFKTPVGVTYTEGYDPSDNNMEICPGAFSGCTNLKFVGYMDSEGTLSASNQLPANTTDIHYAAFKECSSLASFDFMSTPNLETIAEQAFMGCSSIPSAELPVSVITVGSAAFTDCSSLISFKVNWDDTNVIVVEKDSFPSCFLRSENNERISIPGELSDGTAAADVLTAYYNKTGWGYYMIISDDLLEDGYDDNRSDSFTITVEYSSTTKTSDLYDHLVDYFGSTFNDDDRGDLGALNIVGTMSSADFLYMRNFSEISLYQSSSKYIKSVSEGLHQDGTLYEVQTIPSGAFKDNTILTKITMPYQVELTIKSEAFMGCTNLTEVSTVNTNKLYTIEDRAFMNCTSLATFSYLPRTADSWIGESAFENCYVLKTLGVTSARNTSTTTPGLNLMFPYYTTSTDSYIPCTSYTGLTSIGKRAFANCKLLCSGTTPANELILPPTLEFIGEEAFAGCESISSVYLLWPSDCTYIPTISANVFPDAFVKAGGVAVYGENGYDADLNANAVSNCVRVVSGTEGLYNGISGWRKYRMATGSSASSETDMEFYADNDLQYEVLLIDGRVSSMSSMLAAYQEANDDYISADNASTYGGLAESKIIITGFIEDADVSDLTSYCAQQSGKGWEEVDLSKLTEMSTTTSGFMTNAVELKTLRLPSDLKTITDTVGKDADNLTSIYFNWTDYQFYNNVSVTSSTFPDSFKTGGSGSIYVPSSVVTGNMLGEWSSFNIINEI